MKMLNNGLGADGFATSRIPIPSPRSTKMGEGDPLCAARPPERPAQVHHVHHVEDGAVAEHVDGVDAREKGYKKQWPSSHRPSTMCGRCRHAMARKRKRTTTRRAPRRRRIKGGAAPFIVDFKKGFQLLTDTDMWKIPSKAEVKSAKQRVADYKRQYRASGTRDSYNKWLVKKGYAKKTGCSLM